jgi:hypothetical protein
LLEKHGIHTALQCARKPGVWVKRLLTSPFHNIWRELNGQYVLPLLTAEKTAYQSIPIWQTFTPPPNDWAFVLAQFSKKSRMPASRRAIIGSPRERVRLAEDPAFSRAQDRGAVLAGDSLSP